MKPAATRGALALLAVIALGARAEDGTAAPEKKEAPKKRVLRLEEMTVEGRIQKPQAFFILQRSNLTSFDSAEKKESFLPKIVKSCEKEPF